MASRAHFATEKEECRGAQAARRSPLRQFSPVLVVMVGLPGRGKSLLAKRLSRYLNYTGDKTRVYDISEYRRKHMKQYDSHEMFRADNLPAWRIRQQSFREALEDAASWLQQPNNQVAILDGPNVSRAQRQEIYDLVYTQMGFRVMFIECVCEDPVLLERNFKEILQYSADYRKMATEEALKDLTHKMAHYKAQYESPTLGSLWELSCPMVKVLDGGEGGIIAHGVNGPKESKILAYISQPKPYQQTLYFSRHGESEYNVIGRIGGDACLSPRGRMYSHSLAKHIHALNLPSLQIWTSTLQRTKATAALIQAPQQHLHELDEIWSGDCESLSYEELQEHFPRELALRDREKLKYRYPQGESYVDVMQRLVPVLTQQECETNILTISHQAVLRCILGYFLETPPEEIPYIHVPLHTIIKLTLQGYNYNLETVKMPIDCVDTNRAKPLNCSEDRSAEDALLTLPAHYDSVTSVKIYKSLEVVKIINALNYSSTPIVILFLSQMSATPQIDLPQFYLVLCDLNIEPGVPLAKKGITGYVLFEKVNRVNKAINRFKIGPIWGKQIFWPTFFQKKELLG